ncbi:MAG: AraC family transcriptional regulator ligand-binding domain-containing protein [Phenylobacterium sp.]|uniref:helix-turn-helix domain-containing protein n=1 Tax=Phenylobacterium sp. TaxID=1871053 RepID=UPI0025F89A38|nr:AraC family transcriptional regulator [Phenylobacterium sp.]MCA6245324.1 AraC family transcriptional regulator ligand-binding domain-containing protein [Phenylobacterium sp.]MCA6254879.1 AraC family transcriptional regulator ligand-binding domain-containing protein [Phenylobacterium sp.]
MPSSYSALVLREWGASPEVREALGAGGRDPDSPVIDVRQQAAQLSKLASVLPPGWGLKLGALFDSAAHGPLGVGVQSAATLSDALDLIASYGHVRTPFIRFAICRHSPRVMLRFIDTGILDEACILPIHEATLVGIQSTLRNFIGPSSRSISISIETFFPAPDYADRYPAFLMGELNFSCRETSLSFDPWMLTKRSPLADPELFQLARGQLQRLAHAIDTEGALVAQVRQRLSAAEEMPALPEMASALRISSRTLVRRLGEVGASYRSLVDDARRARAEMLLKEGALTAEEIGYRLGYSDSANFGRSCRRWFGCSGGEYRRRLLSGRSAD